VTAQVDVIRWGAERARTSPWRGDGSVAYLTPVPDAPVPSAAFIERCCERLAQRGYKRVLTSALAQAEQQGFRRVGFDTVEELHLLAHDLRRIPAAPDISPAAIHRATPADRPAVLAVDDQAFPPFWQLGDIGLADALQATPRTRFRVARLPNADVAGYAVTGRSGRRGFLQRLAVRPELRRRGIAQALVLDGLRWLRRWRVERVVVNTQLDNAAALALYEQLGFRREPSGLCVLAREL
jgi:ribosomal protein S18 acetylase RimI-like enzyme